MTTMTISKPNPDEDALLVIDDDTYAVDCEVKLRAGDVAALAVTAYQAGHVAGHEEASKAAVAQAAKAYDLGWKAGKVVPAPGRQIQHVIRDDARQITATVTEPAPGR